MDKELEKFIEDNRDLIDYHQWKELYEKVGNINTWADLADLLLKVGITAEEIIKDLGGLPDSAFASCKNLKVVIIPSGVKSISSGVFFYCSNLTSIEIPNSLENIGYYVFEGCKNLTDINYKGTKEQFKDINKPNGWDNDTGNYTIHCIDGDLAKGE